MRRGRVGRPGLVGTMARTAVIAGTATAVHGAVSGKSASKQEAAAADQQAAQQAAAADQQAAAEAAQAQSELQELKMQQAAQEAATAAVAQAQAATPPPAAGGVDVVAEIQKLVTLKESGVLSDEEFAAAKAKLLS